MQKSDLYIAYDLLDQYPQDYIQSEKVVLLAKVGRYREAFELCVGKLKDVKYAEKIAKLTLSWRPQDKGVFTQLHSSLQKYGHPDIAKQILM